MCYFKSLTHSIEALVHILLVPVPRKDVSSSFPLVFVVEEVSSAEMAWCGCGRGRRSSSPLPWQPQDIPEGRWRRVGARATQDSICSSSALLPGRRSASSSLSSGGRFSTTTQDTLLPPDSLNIPDIIIPPSSLFPPPGLQPPTRRSSAESPCIPAPELKTIEHVSQLDFPEDGSPCLFCKSAPTSTTHDPSMLSALSGGKSNFLITHSFSHSSYLYVYFFFLKIVATMGIMNNSVFCFTYFLCGSRRYCILTH